MKLYNPIKVMRSLADKLEEDAKNQGIDKALARYLAESFVMFLAGIFLISAIVLALLVDWFIKTQLI